MLLKNILIRSTKSTIKKFTSSINNLDYHNNHKAKALNAIKVIKQYSDIKLTPILKQQANDYADTILGGIHYAPWLYVYSLISGQFKEGWIPDNFFGTLVSPTLGLSQVSGYKTFSKIILKTELLPDLAYHIDGILYDGSLNPTNLDKLKKDLSGQTHQIFLKRNTSDKGKGINKLAVDSIDMNVLKSIGNCVFQMPIKQHPLFEEINSGSVANIRITTVRNLEAKMEFRASHLNFGRQNNKWVEANNFIQIPVINLDGETHPYGYSRTWNRYDKHPDSGVPFANIRIPKFKEAVEKCLQLHTTVPHFLVIGWDIAINDQEKIQLMEWNAGHIGINLDEAVCGPCFKGLNWEIYKQS